METEDVQDKVPVTPTGIFARKFLLDAPGHIFPFSGQRR
jgi:hypothetical protein